MNTELLPEWTDCQSAFASGTATPLTEFIRAYEPIQSTRPNDKAADEWRQGLASVLDLTATRMRDACVAKIREIARFNQEYEQAMLKSGQVTAASERAANTVLLDSVAEELESLTPDQVEQKQ